MGDRKDLEGETESPASTLKRGPELVMILLFSFFLFVCFGFLFVLFLIFLHRLLDKYLN